MTRSPPADEPQAEEHFKEAYRRARTLAPVGTSHRAMTTLIQALREGASDDQALDLLAQEERDADT